MLLLLPVMIVLGLAAAYVVPRVIEFVDVDRCLDQGGSFDYSARTCVTSMADDE